MKLSLLFTITLLLLGSACGKKVKLTSIPRSETSALQSEQIDKLLDGYEEEFAELGIKINLHKLPVIVGKISPTRLGECHFDEKNNGRAIVLSKELFVNSEENDFKMTMLESVLLHEIGHCYFKREHTKESIDFHGKAYFYSDEVFLPGFGPYRLIISSHNIPVSIMNTNAIEIPKAFRKYYVAEIAKKSRITKAEDLPGFEKFEEISASNFSNRTIEAPITGGEVKILYPCAIADLLPLEKEEKENIVFLEKQDGKLLKSGVIYRLQSTKDGEDITLKFRKSNAPITISESGYNYLRKTDGELKCEMDVTYDHQSPSFVSSCGYKTEGNVLKQAHKDFLLSVFVPPFLVQGQLNRYEVAATKWKLRAGGFTKKPTVEMWQFRDECILEASAKFEGMNNALSTLAALKASIPFEPSHVQGNKTGRVLEINSL